MNEFKTRTRLLLVGGVVSGLLSGCGQSMPRTPTLPRATFTARTDFSLPPLTSFRYETAKSDANPLEIDGLTVKVTPLGRGSVAEVPDVAVSCEIPGAVDVSFVPAGMAVLLSIKNDTGHIVLLNKSTMAFEDDAGKEYALVGDNLDFMLAQQVDAVFDPISLQVEAAHQQSRADGIAIVDRAMAAYRPVWDKYVADVKDCDPGFFSKLMAGGSFKGECAAADPRLSYSAQQARLLAELDQTLGQSADFGAAKASCRQKTTEKMAALRGEITLITEANYDKVKINPGKTMRAFIPMVTGKNFAGPPRSVRFKLYDFVTRTDQAGNPTKRSHFEFDLQRKDDQPAPRAATR